MDLQKQIDELKQEIDKLKTRRVSQADILPDNVKARHISEGVRFIQAGLAADLPDVYTPTQGVQLFFATDTNTLYIYNGTSWVSEVLT